MNPEADDFPLWADLNPSPAPVNQVAGDEPPFVHSGPSIWMNAEFGGGDPTLCRVRTVSITIPVLGVNDDITEYGEIVVKVLAELARLGTLKSFETNGPLAPIPVTGETS